MPMSAVSLQAMRMNITFCILFPINAMNPQKVLERGYSIITDSSGIPLNIHEINPGDNVKVVVPYRTGNGERSTFYGYMILHAKIIYIEGCRALYHVDSIESFIDAQDYARKWHTTRLAGCNYFFDYRSSFEVMLPDTYYDKV